MRAAFDDAATTDGSSIAIGTSVSTPSITEVDRDGKRQRVRADHVLDHAVGGLERKAARIDRGEAAAWPKRCRRSVMPSR